MTGFKQSSFDDVFGRAPIASATIPGRVNLIGEHIDYTGGTVLPTTIPSRLVVQTAPTMESDRVQLYSTRFEKIVERPIGDPLTEDWSDYALAGHRKAVKEGLAQGGASYLIDSNIPHGAGVSSSAALLVAILTASAQAANADISPVQIARWAQEIEVEDIGMPCGIMDQMAVAVGQAGFALALDTDSLNYELVPLPVDYAFPVYHSGLTRALADGQYKSRREATEIAARELDAPLLSQADAAARAKLETLDEPIRRRARHAITEHQRVLNAITSLKQNDAETFGRLMIESHRSMRDDFEITPPEMDAMTDYAVEAGALGSRLTGGGFGGCFVSLVKRDHLTSWMSAMTTKFPGIRIVSEG